MRRWGWLCILVVAGAQVAQAAPQSERPQARTFLDQSAATPTSTPIAVPTVAIVQSTPVSVPTVTIPKPTATATSTPRLKATPAKKPKKKTKSASKMRGTWIWAYLTSYCPGSAGWLSSSGMPVFYGMLANDFYRFGTRVYIPVLGIVGVVEDHVGDYSWNHFDVWSGVCYSTPTGYFKVKVLG